MEKSNNEKIKDIVEQVIKELENNNEEYLIPVGISNRHIHLTKDDLKVLFGEEYNLTIKKNVKQPGQFAANETVTIAGPKGCFKNVRILGPVREYSQIEISRSDAYTLGINPPVRSSKDLKDSETLSVIGPKGMKIFNRAVICAKRHVHMTFEEAKKMGLEHGQLVKIETLGHKGVIFKNVLVRVSDTSALEFHIDTDEANAAELKSNELVKIISK